MPARTMGCRLTSLTPSPYLTNLPSPCWSMTPRFSWGLPRRTLIPRPNCKPGRWRTAANLPGWGARRSTPQPKSWPYSEDYWRHRQQTKSNCSTSLPRLHPTHSAAADRMAAFISTSITQMELCSVVSGCPWACTALTSSWLTDSKMNAAPSRTPAAGSRPRHGSLRCSLYARPCPSAFTLIELLTVIAIIAVLASLLMTSVVSAKKKSRAAVCTFNLHQIGLALNMYLDDEGKHPSVDLLATSKYLPSGQSWLCPEDR